jgi:hypothetical protein
MLASSIASSAVEGWAKELAVFFGDGLASVMRAMRTVGSSGVRQP